MDSKETRVDVEPEDEEQPKPPPAKNLVETFMEGRPGTKRHIPLAQTYMDSNGEVDPELRDGVGAVTLPPSAEDDPAMTLAPSEAAALEDATVGPEDELDATAGPEDELDATVGPEDELDATVVPEDELDATVGPGEEAAPEIERATESGEASATPVWSGASSDPWSKSDDLRLDLTMVPTYAPSTEAEAQAGEGAATDEEDEDDLRLAQTFMPGDEAAATEEDEDDPRLAQTFMPADEAAATEEDEDDPRLAQTFMPADEAAATEEDEDDPRLAQTFMPADEAAATEEDEDDFRLAQTFMPEEGRRELEGSSPDMTFMPQGGGDVVDLEGSSPDMTFMPQGGGDVVDLEGSSPDMTFMPQGGGDVVDLEGSSPDMTFMPQGGGDVVDLEGSSPDMTFMPQGGGDVVDLEGSSPDMTFMPQGGGDVVDLEGSSPDMTFMPQGGGDVVDLEGSSPDMTFMPQGEGDEEVSDVTFMHDPGAESAATLYEPGNAGSSGAPDPQIQTQRSPGRSASRSASTSGRSASTSGRGASRSGRGASASGRGASQSGGLSRSVGGRSRSALRSQRHEDEVVVARIRGDEVKEELYAGTYRLLGELARGGMGAVYKALHVNLNEIRALKLMLAGAHASDDARRRFMFEAEACARLRHPNVLLVNDVGEVDGNLYFTMPFIKGSDLKERKAELTREQLLDVMIKTCRGVAYAHQKGIIHRDLKPANVMMTVEGEPLVMDFGLAKQLEDVDKEDEALAESELSRTTEGAIMGTPYYMSPEQAQGRIHDVDTRTDVWALGVMLYQLWTLKLPFKAKSATKILQMIVNDEPERPRVVDPTVDPDLEAIILKAIEKDPDKRYSTAGDLEADLTRYKNGEVVSAQLATPRYRLEKWLRRNRRQVLVGAAGVLLVLGSIGALVAQNVAQRWQAESEIRERIAQSTSALEANDASLRAHESRVLALNSAKAEGKAREDPRERLGALQSELSVAVELLGKLEAAAGPLGAHRETHLDAESAHQAYLERRRAVEARAKTLERLIEGVEHALGAREALGRLRPLEARATSALVNAVVQPLEEATLARAVAVASSTLAKSAVAPVTSAFAATRASLSAEQAALREQVYAALSRLPAQAPEAVLARELLTEADDLVRRVDAEREQAAGKNRARELLNVARSLAGVLRAQEPLKKRDDAARRARFEAGRLAKALGREALELPAVEGRRAALLEIQAVYCRALLTLRAYQAFDLEVEDEHSLRPSEREALIAERDVLLEKRQALLKKLEGAVLRIKITRGNAKVRGSGSGNPMVFLGAMGKLRTLRKVRTDPLMDSELESLRQSRITDVKETIARLARDLVSDQFAALFAAQLRFDHEDLDGDGAPGVCATLKDLAARKLISKSLGRGNVIAYRFKLVRGADPTRWAVQATPSAGMARGMSATAGDPPPHPKRETRLFHYALNHEGQALVSEAPVKVDPQTCALEGGEPVFTKLKTPPRPQPAPSAPGAEGSQPKPEEPEPDERPKAE